MADDYKKWMERFAELKKAWGITAELADIKFQKLLLATNGNPTVDQVVSFLRGYVTPASIESALMAAVSEWKDLFKTGKSVPKHNRSALA